MARDLLGCVGHGAASLEPILTCCPASWLRAPACLAITMAPCPQWSHRPSLHLWPWSISALTPRQQAPDVLTNLPEILLL